MAKPLQPDDLDGLSHRLRRVLRASHEANLATARRMDLGLNDVAALDLLALDGPQGAAQIARRLGMRPASATVLVDRLEAAGHVERARGDADRRRVTVTPTLKAYRDALGAMDPMLRALDAAAAELDAGERDVVDGYLTRVHAAMQAYIDETPY